MLNRPTFGGHISIWEPFFVHFCRTVVAPMIEERPHRPLFCLPIFPVEYKSLTYRKLRIFARSNLAGHFLTTNCLSTTSIQRIGRQVQLNGAFSPTSRTSAPPMDIQNAPPRAPRAGQWRTATTRTAHGSGISVRLFGEERYRGLLSRSS